MLLEQPDWASTMSSALGDVVRLGGLALQAEDCAIQAALHHRGEYGGLVRAQNEKYHQFIIWRAVLPIWHAVIERENATDIVLTRDKVKHYFELKNWRGYTGIPQLKFIRKDVQKLNSRENGYILITSLNSAEHTERNFSYLVDEVKGLEPGSRKDFRFSTKGLDGGDLEFWIAGWSVIRSQV
jgi:hypothetical protein